MDPKDERLYAIPGRIRAVRKELDKSGEWLAKLAGTSQSAISALENGGVRHVELAKLWAIADALGVRVEWLITGNGQKWSKA